MGTNLRDRATQSAAARGLARTDDVGGELAERKPATLADQIRGMHDQFALAMPQGAEARQLIRDALSLLKTTKNLAECDPATVLGGLMTFAQLGLRPGVLGHGWLLPFKTRANVTGRWVDVYKAQIVIGYKGYAELVHRSGQIETMVGRAVHEHDDFDMEYGITDRLVHRPRMRGDRGQVTGYYAIIKYQGGGYVFWYMTRDEAEAWRDAYAMSVRRGRDGQPVLDDNGKVQGSGPWFDHKGPAGGTGFDQQAIKTCFLRAQKWAPKGLDLTLARATEADGGVRYDIDLDPDRMLEVERPEDDLGSGDVIDVEPEGGDPVPPPVRDVGTPAPAQRPAAEPAPVAAPVAALQTEFPPVPGNGDDPPVSQGLTTSIGRIIGKAGVSDDAERKAIVGRLAGRTAPIGSTKDLTAAEGRQVLQLLSGWETAGTLGEQLAAVLAAAAPTAAAHPGGHPGEQPAPADPGGVKLPDRGTRAWHDAGHPDLVDGRVVTIPALLNGDCGLCEQQS